MSTRRRSGCNAATLVFDATTMTLHPSLVADASHVFVAVTLSGGASQIVRIELDSGTLSPVAHTRASPRHVDEKFVYYHENEHVMRAPKTGGVAVPVFAVQWVPQSGLATTEDGLYFVNDGSGVGVTGELYWVPTTGSLPATPVRIAEGGLFDDDDYPRGGLVIDAPNVFWVAGGPTTRADDEGGWIVWAACTKSEG